MVFRLFFAQNWFAHTRITASIHYCFENWLIVIVNTSLFLFSYDMWSDAEIEINFVLFGFVVVALEHHLMINYLENDAVQILSTNVSHTLIISFSLVYPKFSTRIFCFKEIQEYDKSAWWKIEERFSLSPQKEFF